MIGIDGVDFINIYSKGKTNLGRWLSNFAWTPISTPDGDFASIEGYWYWLTRGRDDRLRTLYGYEAKDLGKKLFLTHCENFEDKIRDAIDIKIKSDREMMLELAHSNLPFTHFYQYGDKRIHAGYEWIVEHIDARRAALKAWVLEKGL